MDPNFFCSKYLWTISGDKGSHKRNHPDARVFEKLFHFLALAGKMCFCQCIQPRS